MAPNNTQLPTRDMFIDLLPQMVTNLADPEINDKKCYICYSKMSDASRSDDGDRYPTILPCTHYFCTGCITTWLEENNSCPMCRVQLFVEPSAAVQQEIFPIYISRDDATDRQRMGNVIQLMDTIVPTDGEEHHTDELEDRLRAIAIARVHHYLLHQYHIDIDDYASYAAEDAILHEPIVNQDFAGAVDAAGLEWVLDNMYLALLAGDLRQESHDRKPTVASHPLAAVIVGRIERRISELDGLQICAGELASMLGNCVEIGDCGRQIDQLVRAGQMPGGYQQFVERLRVNVANAFAGENVLAQL